MMHINYIGSFCLIVLGMYCMIAKKDMMRTCIGMGMTDYGANLLIVNIVETSSPDAAQNAVEAARTAGHPSSWILCLRH